MSKCYRTSRTWEVEDELPSRGVLTLRSTEKSDTSNTVALDFKIIYLTILGKNENIIEGLYRDLVQSSVWVYKCMRHKM